MVVKDNSRAPYFFEGETYEVVDQYTAPGYDPSEGDVEFVVVKDELGFPAEFYAEDVELV